MKNPVYDLGHASLGGGITVYTRTIEKGGDYAALITFSNVYHFTDGQVLALDLNPDFKTENARRQLKEYLLSVNNRLLFADENTTPPESYGDENEFSPDELKDALLEHGYQSQTPENREILRWAERKGYLISISFTQAQWTQKGVDWARAQKEKHV